MGGCNPLIFNDDDEFYIIDQRFLPKEAEVKLNNLEDICNCIKDMAVRGAPLIGIVAAFGFYLGIKDASSHQELKLSAQNAFKSLISTRPTAVNLKWALNSQMSILNDNIFLPTEKIIKKIRANAFGIWQNQKEADIKLAQNALELFKNSVNVLTHCNTGSFATGGVGTALGIIKEAHKKGLINEVFVGETRPYFQGTRISAFELSNENINYTIVTDNSCGILMKKHLIDMVIVGADRIAKNGDTANKIGTYLLALAAKAHNVKFIVAAPESTIDRELNDLSNAEIEIRSPNELTKCFDIQLSPPNAKALYYAFDITPGNFIDYIITEKNIYKQPFKL